MYMYILGRERVKESEVVQANIRRSYIGKLSSQGLHTGMRACMYMRSETPS